MAKEFNLSEKIMHEPEDQLLPDCSFIDIDYVKEFISRVKIEIKTKISFHFDEIQKIIGKKESGNIDINLDILMKIHNNCLQDLRDQLRIIETYAGEKLK